MVRRIGKGILAASLLGGCNFGEGDGRPMVERVLVETPRLAQLAFNLAEAPRSTYNTDGRYPDWVGAVSFQRFEWTKRGDQSYEAHAVATLTAGPGLGDGGAAPPTTRGTLDVTVEFVVHETPPPVIFLPRGHSLQPMRWRLHAVNGAPSTETGPCADYRE